MVTVGHRVLALGPYDACHGRDPECVRVRRRRPVILPGSRPLMRLILVRLILQGLAGPSSSRWQASAAKSG